MAGQNRKAASRNLYRDQVAYAAYRESANSLPQLLGLLLGFLPPVYYPLDEVPGYLQPLA